MTFRKPWQAPRCSLALLSLPIAVISGAFWLLVVPASAAIKPNPHAAAAVQKTLAAEPKGGAASRDQQLAKVIESAPDYSPARWAAGYVEQDGKWMKFDSLPEGDAKNEKVVEYRRLRDQAPDTAEGQLKLANWCRQHSLKEQERAHLLRVLDFEPNRTDLRERLGMVHVGGVWMLPREARQAAARGKQAVADLKHWLPKVEKFRAALEGPAGRVRDLAMEHVRAIRDPSAIVALETVLAPSSDDAGAAVADALAAMKRPEASIALARLAAFSESSDTTDAARAKLKTLPRDHFVPAMLASLVVPGATQTTITSDRYGRLLFQQAFAYEGADRKQVAVFDNVYRIYSAYGRRRRAGSDGVLAASALGSAETAGRSIAADAQNRRIERTNARIIDTLRDVTGQTLSADPHAWWQWWNDVNEIVPVGDKQTDVTYVVEERALPSFETRARPHCSCLIAGTPIWTDRGLVAVDKMQVGDRVLAQDPASGELCYKPVLRTTVRPRAPLIHITLPDETIVASGGHPFWVAGQGWVNASHLQPEMLIHTVTGAVPIEKVELEENGKQPVFNLVVEDFHNYFAGKSHLLLHDITPREPTLGPVPGWQE
ncbi:MAG TPA: polymorphic toxin-type HINT domain-containing protein [Pirellulales bacterium]|nr:polymorphic toxin-type HINT domain-containing protein [Pirellulales bacterium]